MISYGSPWLVAVFVFEVSIQTFCSEVLVYIFNEVVLHDHLIGALIIREEYGVFSFCRIVRYRIIKQFSTVYGE